MARIWQSGFELNTTVADKEWTTTSGVGTVFTISTGTVRTGTYAGKFLANNTAVGQARYNFAASDQTTGFYFRTYFQLTTAISSANNIIFIKNTANASKIALRLNTDNTLTLRNAEDSLSIGSNSSALNTNQWYRLELFVDTTTIASTTVTARIDGSQFATGSANLLTGIANLTIGMDQIFATGEFYFDDIAINDTTGSFQNSWPGSGKILHLNPNAAGDSNGFLAQIGGTAGSANNYTRVNEVPPNDATSYNGSAALNAEDLFNCADSGIGVADNVNVVALGVRMADLVGADATAAFKLEIEKTASGTKSQSGNLVPNSTAWLTNAAIAPRNYPLVTYQDPDGASWTQTTLDSMQIGYTQDVTNVQTIAVSAVWASVDYSPAGVSPSASASPSSSVSPSSSISSSISPSASISASTSPSSSASPSISPSSSLSASISPSSSVSASTSPSSSSSPSLSPSSSISASTSPSTSRSPSSSISASTSPSASRSPSSSASASLSPSSSTSPSSSPSPSLSPSSSISASDSPSASVSPSPSEQIYGVADDITTIQQFDNLVATQQQPDGITALSQVDSITITKSPDDIITVLSGTRPDTSHLSYLFSTGTFGEVNAGFGVDPI